MGGQGGATSMGHMATYFSTPECCCSIYIIFIFNFQFSIFHSHLPTNNLKYQLLQSTKIKFMKEFLLTLLTPFWQHKIWNIINQSKKRNKRELPFSPFQQHRNPRIFIADIFLLYSLALLQVLNFDQGTLNELNQKGFSIT